MANMRREPTRDEPPEVQQDRRRIVVRRKLGGDFLERREKVPVRGWFFPFMGHRCRSMISSSWRKWFCT
jgi:hypothetical protein